jgi:hypothetical protein
MIVENLEDHEGYAARRLPDDTLTSTWTRDTAAFDANSGACTCGWTSTDQQQPTEAGRTPADEKSEHAHARALLAAAVPTRISELIDNPRGAAAELADHRPLAAQAAAQRLTAVSEHILHLTATTELHHRLHTLGHQAPGPRPLAVTDHGSTRC